jgi:hypothetical protein
VGRGRARRAGRKKFPFLAAKAGKSFSGKCLQICCHESGVVNIVYPPRIRGLEKDDKINLKGFFLAFFGRGRDADKLFLFYFMFFYIYMLHMHWLGTGK